MDFELVLDRLSSSFAQQDIRYALIGGFAMGFWGIHRATMDLDLMVLTVDAQKTEKILSELGYELFHKDENVSQYRASVRPLGSIDILHAFRERAKEILSRAQLKPALGGKIELPVATPGDLVGLKLQAYSNAERSNPFDLADIEALIERHGAEMDLEIVSSYFTLFDQGELWKDLRSKYTI